MIGQIGHTSCIESLVNYHQKKIKEGVAQILQSHKVQTYTSGQINASFRSYSYLNEEKNPYTHISLNFHPKDNEKLSDTLYQNLSKEYLDHLGYNDQPFLLIKHTDQDHPHVHIITTTIKDDGNKIPKFNERYRSQNISRELELKHGLTIVSSIKEEKDYSVNISNKSDLKNYLKSSIKETLSLKPKREEDFINILKNQYQIDMYKTPKKGVSFHIFEKEGGINVQQHNGFGVKGMSGSSIYKEYSLPKIKEKLQNNFKTAPKRYRNLKLAEEKLTNELEFFSSVKIEDSNFILESKGLKTFSENKKTYVIDTKGKNLYASRDLKGFDFTIFSNETVLNKEKLPKLFHTISEEAFYTYKQDISPYLKESIFIDKIALKDTFLSYIDTSDTFKAYEPYITKNQIEILEKSAAAYFSNKYSAIEAIKKSEELTEKDLKQLVISFARSNNIPFTKLNNLMELVDIKEQYTQHNTIRNTVTLIQAIQQEISPPKDSSKKAYVTSGSIFQHQNYFNREDLSPEQKKHYEKVVSGPYIKSVLYYVKANMISPEDFIKMFNNRGIRIHVEVNERGKESISASIENFEYKIQLRGVKEFILETLKKTDQNVENDLKNIQFKKALDDDYGPTLHYLYKQGGISNELAAAYEKTTHFKEETTKEEIRSLLQEKYYEYRKEYSSNYESEFIPYFVNNIEEFKEFIGSNKLLEEESYSDLFDSFVEKKSSNEYLRETSRKEEERLINKGKLARKTGSTDLAGLLGIKGEGEYKTDFNGKYRIQLKGEFSPGLKNLQEASYFKYYSSVFESASKQIFYDQEEYRKDPTGILVYNEFEKFIPEKHKDLYKNLFIKNYLKHYLDVIKNFKEIEPNSISLYLNIKGINIEHDKKEIKLSFIGNEIKFDLKELEPSLYEKLKNITFSSTEILTKESVYEQVQFNLAIENGNYDSAAYLLKHTNAKLLLSSEDKKEHQELLNKAILKVEIKTSLNDSYYSLYKESGFNYESDFLVSVYSNTDKFVNYFKNTGEFDTETYNDTLQEYLRAKLSIDNLNNVVEKEEIQFTSKIELANQIGEKDLAALFGVIQIDDNTVSDYHGKYTTSHNMNITESTKNLQKQPYFKYYSGVFERTSKEMFNGEETVLDPNGILVYREFEHLIPEQHKKDYLNSFTSNYINYYVNKMSTYNFTSSEEKINYLNSKGIRIIKSDKEGTSLKIVKYPEHTTINLESLKLNKVSTDEQIAYFRSNGFLKESSFYKQIEFNNAIENGNYMGAAWLLKKNEAKNLLSSKELEEHKEALNKALKDITPNTLYTDILAISKIVLDDKSQGGPGNKNNKKNKKKRRKL
ncbi:relaxase/mobilization nuclease domain-containing protein (plasmid) [Aquimarina sp. TRL1]|uniref:relaxase/mobilization nuclease domain-containing protein n=1 Tax=Aquimarina sp. (strain TRL1) TaxID=2736252 RepID=UPI00158CA8AA|nr:relaxase/mobilization nuclease domain-containing protein [Aquimarina sp. TRL1]QKX07736.1 relaxase/mobilization nuclease domain-containing protein [Aquimarina sp. TRL1]